MTKHYIILFGLAITFASIIVYNLTLGGLLLGLYIVAIGYNWNECKKEKNNKKVLFLDKKEDSYFLIVNMEAESAAIHLNVTSKQEEILEAALNQQ